MMAMEAKWWLLPLVPPIVGIIIVFGIPVGIGLVFSLSMLTPIFGAASLWYFLSLFYYAKAESRPSIDPGFSRFVRAAQSLLPLTALRSGSVAAREFLRLSISQESNELKFNSSPLPESVELEQKGFKIETISLPGQNEDAEEVSFVFFHGGAMSLCDSADLLLCQRLLPLISHFCDGAGVMMYSVLYTTASDDNSGTWTTVQKEILESFTMIEAAMRSKNPNGKCATIMGDSAGGHLSLCLGMQLVHLEHPRIPSLALISPWLNCFKGNRYSYLTRQVEFKDDILHDTFIQSSIFNYWAGADSLDQSAFELRTQTDLSLPAHAVNPWLSSKELIQKLPSILCLAGSNEVLIEEIRGFWDEFITDSSALRAPSGATAKPKVKFAVDSETEAADGGVEGARKCPINIKVSAQSPQSAEVTKLGVSGAVRELVVTDAEIHAFPLFWRHPLRRILAPIGLTVLFELLYPPTRSVTAASAKGAATPSTPATPVTPATPSSEADLTWRDVATPGRGLLGGADGAMGQVLGLLPSLSEGTIDSPSADAAITRLAQFVAAEHQALGE